MLNLGIIIASVREGRTGEGIAVWFAEFARKHAGFEISTIDLKRINLPMFDEPHHPRLQKYTREHTKAWSALIAPLDAFVFILPEYNYGTPPALVNALDYLHVEWQYKAAGFVSYGGIAGGTRSVQMTKLYLQALKMVPLLEGIIIPFAGKLKDETTGVFRATEQHEASGKIMLDELLRWTNALKTLRP
jgi:NAD(P)H-dependent FMN reductase